MKLILLRCPNCNEPLKPGNDDVVILCPNCFRPVAIAVDGAQSMQIRFVMPNGIKGTGSIWHPFWVFEGRVQITRRETQGGDHKAGKASEELWGSTRRLYVPAWDLDLHLAQEIGSRLILEQNDVQTIDQPENAHLMPAVVTPQDARKLLEFVVLAIEARRKDWLKDLAFQLDIGQPELWALPEKGYS